MSQEQMVAETVDSIKSHLKGKPPAVQGAVLADLLAMWLAGHFADGDPIGTRKLREEVLAMHCSMVRQLLTINAKLLGTL